MVTTRRASSQAVPGPINRAFPALRPNRLPTNYADETLFFFGRWRFLGLAGIGLGIKVPFDQWHRYRPIRQEMIRQHADGAATGPAQKPVNVFLLLVIAIGIALISAVAVNFVMGIHRTRGAVPFETGTSNLHGPKTKPTRSPNTSPRFPPPFQFGFPPFRLATLASTPGTQIEAPPQCAA